MSTDEPSAEPDPQPEVQPEAQPAQASNRGLRTALVALAAIGLGLAILAASLSATHRKTTSRLADVRRVAAAFASAFNAYDYRHLDRQKAAVLRLSTGTFKKEYQSGFDDGLAPILTATKGISTVRDITVFVGELNDHTADVIVVADLIRSGSGGKRAVTSYIELSMVKAGDWRIDDVASLNLGLPAAGGTTTTTTTAPSAPTTSR